MKNKAQELAVQYQSQTRKPPARKAAAVDMAVDEEEEEDANEEEEDEEEEEEEEEKLQTYQNAMYGNIRLDGVVAFIFDASGSMQGAKEKRVKRETIDLLNNLPNGVTFCMSSYGDVMRTWMDHTVGTLPQDRDSAIEWMTSSYVCDGGSASAMPQCLQNMMCVEDLGQVLLLCDGDGDEHLSSLEIPVPVNTTFVEPSGGQAGCIEAMRGVSERTGGCFQRFNCE